MKEGWKGSWVLIPILSLRKYMTNHWVSSSLSVKWELWWKLPLGKWFWVRTHGCHECCPVDMPSSLPLAYRVGLLIPFHIDARCYHFISSGQWNMNGSGMCHYWEETLRASMQLGTFQMTAAISVLVPEGGLRGKQPPINLPYTHVAWATNIPEKTKSVGNDVEKLEGLFTADGNAKWV